jgi:response regulator of citrate/malate metabolism
MSKVVLPVVLKKIVEVLEDGDKTLKQVAVEVEKSISAVYKVVIAAIDSGHIKECATLTEGSLGRPAKIYTLTAKGKKLAAMK